MPTYSIDYRRIEELPGAGRLGRQYKRDSRSAAYLYQRKARQIASVAWLRHIDILDQDGHGSCTGEFMCGALATDPLFAALPPGYPPLDQPFALSVYSDAEILDGGAGLPGEDNGSSGSSVCKIAQKRGLISGYTWCQDEGDAADALQHGPVGFGTNWYAAFDQPSPEGIISLTPGSPVRGGHEYECSEYDQARGLFWCENSWGAGWGLQGRFAVPGELLARLLGEDGDCVAPVPLSVPAPVPQPASAPADMHVDAADRVLIAAVPATWEDRLHIGDTARAARAYSAWKAAKGLR